LHDLEAQRVNVLGAELGDEPQYAGVLAQVDPVAGGISISVALIDDVDNVHPLLEKAGVEMGHLEISEVFG
jgi:hypothetical protein